MALRLTSAGDGTPARPSRHALLREFLEGGLLELPGRHPDYRAQFFTAVDWLERALGRPPRVRHLNAANLEAAMRCLAAAGHSRSRIKQIKLRLAWLWRQAERYGLADEPYRPLTTPSARPDAGDLPDFGPAPAGSLTRFFVDVYRGSIAGRSRSWRNACELAVRRFLQFRGGHPPLAEIEDGTLEAFAAWLAARGLKPHTIQHERDIIRGIVRAARPTAVDPPKRYGTVRLDPLPAPEPGTLRHFFETVYRPQRLLDAAQATVWQYRNTLRLMRQWRGQDLELSALDDAAVADFLKWLLDRGLRPITVNGHRAVVFALWRLAHERGKLETLPRLPKLRAHQDEPDAWTLEEIRRIIAAASAFAPKTAALEFQAGRFWRAFLLTAWYTGLRRKTLLALRRTAADLDRGELTVPAEAMKNRRGKRFRLAPDCIEALRELHAGQALEMLLPWPFTVETLHKHFRAILEAAGVPPSSRKSNTQFHKIRRTVATFAAINGGMEAAASLLGHAGIEVTKRYVDPSKLPGADATALLPDLELAAPAPPAAPGDRLGAGGDRLAEAESLLAQGHATAAAMLARVALERHIRGLARARRVRLEERSLGLAVKALRDARCLEPPAANAMLRAVREANRAAHGAELGPERTAALLAAIRALIGASAAQSDVA